MASPVVGDHAITTLPEEKHLRVPVVPAQRPTVRKNNRLSRAPVLVVNLRSVLHRYRCHKISSLLCCESGAPSVVSKPVATEGQLTRLLLSLKQRQGC